MKTKLKQMQFLTVLVCLLMAVPAALAPTAVEYNTVDPGTTPDSVWYGFELFWESIAEVDQDHTYERFAEMQAMIVERNYEAAQEAVVEAEEIFNNVVETVEETDATEENLDTIHVVEETYLVYENTLETIIENSVAAGEISAEQAEELVSSLEREITDVQAAVENQEEEITDAIAEEQGITHLEAESRIEVAEGESGLTAEHREEVEEELAEVWRQLERVQVDLAQAVAVGREVPPAATELLAEAQARLDECQNAYADGRYGESFGQLTAGEHLLDNAEGFLEGEVSREELIEVVESTQGQRIENEQAFMTEYPDNIDNWIEEFPEHEDDFDDWYEQGQNAILLAEALSDAYAREAEQLRAEGRTEQEIFETLTGQFQSEYERVYGETFIPPVFKVNPGFADGSVRDERLTEFGSLPADRVDTQGGFVEGYVYTDPVTGYTYEFTEDGYTYTTPLGLVYAETFPEGFSVPTAYEQGNEEHSYTTETPEGIVTYNYYATGYDVTLADGTTETYSYPQGRYNVVGGGFFEHSATGFDYRYEGELTRYDYNPEFDTFVREDGVVYNPPKGTYHQDDSFNYNYESHQYEYGDWNYNPGNGEWSSSTGETYTPIANTIAPVGHEDTGSFSTATGETWTYDPVAGSWSSSDGQTFTSEHEGTATGSWADSSGTNYDYSHEGGGMYTDHAGESWSQDSSGSWSSSSGATYSSSGTESGNYGGHAPPAGGFEGSTSGSYSGGGYTGGHDGGSYSGGDSGGSAPSGGDGGGGGHSGGDGGGGGMGGYAVREPREAPELHPVTRWIYKYLGIKN